MDHEDSSSAESGDPKVGNKPKGAKRRPKKRVQNKRAKRNVETDSDVDSGEPPARVKISKTKNVKVADTSDGLEIGAKNDVFASGANDVKKRTIDGDSDSADDVRTRRKVAKKRLKVDKAELERLEKLVLGDGDTLLKNLTILEKDSGVDDDATVNDSDFSDTLASPVTVRSPAWEDVDDENFTKAADVRREQRSLGLKPTSDYKEFLRKRFKDVYGEPSWAKLGKKNDVDDELLRSSGKFIEKSKRLAKGTIDVKRLAYLNSSTRNEGPIVTNVRFHPTANVALIAGANGRANVVTVDGSGNAKLAAVRFEKFPIRCARFSHSGDEFIVGSNEQPHFFVYDLLKGATIKIPLHKDCHQTQFKKFEISPDGKFIAAVGRFGQINLLAANSKEWVASLTMNGSCETICFSSDGRYLYSYGNQGEIYVWDVASRRLKHRFADEGSIKGLSLAVSANDNFIAAGSSSGAVNLYEMNTALSQRHPTPLKAFLNLTTSVTNLAFDGSSQILAMASSHKDNAVKLAHIQSATVFSNFPTFSSQLNCIQDLAISPSSGYLALANNKSTVLLYRLKNFGNY